MQSLIIPATVLLVIASLGGSFDLLYLHLLKYKLYSRAETMREHRIHTFQAVLFSTVVLLLVCRNFQGVVLLIAIAFVAADLGMEMLDILCEKESRVKLGGLSTPEYLLHIMMSSTKFAFVVLALASKPASAWNLTWSRAGSSDYPLLVRVIGWGIFTMGMLSAALQLWLQQARYQQQHLNAARIS